MVLLYVGSFVDVMVVVNVNLLLSSLSLQYSLYAAEVRSGNPFNGFNCN